MIKLFGSYAISREFPLVLRFDMRKFIGGAAGLEVTRNISRVPE